MKKIKFIQVSPEELQETISNVLIGQLEELKKSFEPKSPTEFLSRQEVAKLMKVDISTIHNWAKQGKLQSYGLGGRVYFKRSEVENSLIEL